MKTKILYLSLFSLLICVFSHCAIKLIDLKKQNPKLFKELIRDYAVASEANPGKVEILKFNEDESQSISGKIDNFQIESCNWFFDRKIKTRNSSELPLIVTKTVNLNCGGQYYIIELDRKIDHPGKIKYKGVYKNVFKRLKTALIIEASCSITNVSKNDDDDNDKNTTIECYPYPFDLDRYTKTQKREVVAGYFLYTNDQATLDELMSASAEEKENSEILQSFKNNFVDEESANNEKLNPSIGKTFSFKNCEFIDFRELPTENAKGLELKEKLDKLLESDLNNPSNKESLKDAIEEYRNCGSRCLSRDKEIRLFFEIKGLEAKRKILLIKKIESKSEMSKFKRFKFYSVDGALKSLDFSEKGEIEKIYLNPSSAEPENSMEVSIPENYPSLESDAKQSPAKKEKTKIIIKPIPMDPIQPIPEPVDNNIDPTKK